MSGHIAIFGGTFDPVHNGHMQVARAVLTASTCRDVWFLPTASAPHKRQHAQATAEHRLQMLRLATADEPRFQVSALEIGRGGISYSIETARMLMAQHPTCSFSWVIGADMVQSLTDWVEIEQLSQMVSFIGLARPGYSTELHGLPTFLQGRIQVIAMEPVDLSSTVVRARLRARESVSTMLPAPVYRYIKENGLYETGTDS